ncbi:MAG TPA: hypothetical protein VEK07_11715 [Polyangiaceae bacterium]|nr:hypothetical protein [Polyangiaceae bacterium]
MPRDWSPAGLLHWRWPTARSLLPVFVGGAIVVGALLRFGWLSDMEYKGDERWSFDRSQRVGSAEPWPALGMPSSVGLCNPGLSVWVFVVLARIFGAHHPVALDRAVVACDVSAFVLLFAFVVRGMPSHEGEPWLWGLALAAVNPIAVLLERKIWAQSVLPIFCAAFLIGWLRRDRWWGALSWGVVGALLGQIHMGGFFFAAGFVVWELCAGRFRTDRRKSTRWVPWLAGTTLGVVPFVPWLGYALRAHHRAAMFAWSEIESLRFYRLWLSDTFGLGLDYSLGGQYLDFLRYPIFGSGDTYPALYLQGLSFSVGVYVAASAGGRLWACRGRWRQAPSVLRTASEAAFTGGAALVGYGLLLTATGLYVWRHYLIVTFPLEWTTLACVALASVRRPRRWLAALWTAQLALSLTFLGYIHEHHGAVQGDYGRAFQWQ